MTNEEAIRILKLSIINSREHMRFCYDDKGITAIEMAIKALEELPKRRKEVKRWKRKALVKADGEKSFKMRDATPEEQEAIDKYIKSISKPTGVTFGQADGDYISRQALLDRLDDFNKWCQDGRLQGSLFAIDVIKDMKSVAIPSAYKGMTNGQVHDMLYQMLVDLKDGEDKYGAEKWWNSPYKGEQHG